MASQLTRYCSERYWIKLTHHPAIALVVQGEAGAFPVGLPFPLRHRAQDVHQKLPRGRGDVQGLSSIDARATLAF